MLCGWGVRQAWCNLQAKLCDLCLSALEVVTTMRYTNRRMLYFRRTVTVAFLRRVQIFLLTYLLTYLLTTNTTSVSFVRNHFGGADRAFDVLSVSLICPDHNV